MSGLDETLAPELAELAARHRYRLRRIAEDPAGAEVTLAGRRLVNFCSNDYLGLANHPEVVAALRDGAERWGAGSGAAHLVTGHSIPHHALEEELADFTGRPRALLFSTGYMANLAVAGALTGRGDALFEDRLNHASLIDAARLSGARVLRFRHGEAAALAERLAVAEAARKLVLTDGVFSMDGDIAPLTDLAEVCKGHQAWLGVDDAHGFGVVGPEGRGSTVAAGLGIDDIPILVGTLGKAFGTFGAFVAGSEALIETLIQKARTYIFTTALPPAVAEATRAALRRVRADEWRRDHLRALVARFRHGAQAIGISLGESETPIQPLVVGADEIAVCLSEALLERGLLVSAIRPPTVPEGTARLRVTLSAAHSGAQVDRLLDALAEIWPREEA